MNGRQRFVSHRCLPHLQGENNASDRGAKPIAFQTISLPDASLGCSPELLPKRRRYSEGEQPTWRWKSLEK